MVLTWVAGHGSKIAVALALNAAGADAAGKAVVADDVDHVARDSRYGILCCFVRVRDRRGFASASGAHDGGERLVGLASSVAASSIPTVAHDRYNVASAARNRVRHGFVRVRNIGGRATQRRALYAVPLVARVTGTGERSVGVGALCVGSTVVASTGCAFIHVDAGGIIQPIAFGTSRDFGRRETGRTTECNGGTTHGVFAAAFCWGNVGRVEVRSTRIW